MSNPFSLCQVASFLVLVSLAPSLAIAAASPTPLGPPFAIAPVNSDSGPGYARAARNSTGETVVTWSSYADPTLSIHARRYTPAGVAIGGDQVISDRACAFYPFHDRPVSAIDSSGNYAVAWVDCDRPPNVYPSNFRVMVQRFARSGAAMGAPIRLWDAGNITDVDMAMNADGAFVVAWTDSNRGSAPYRIYARRFAANGSPSTNVITVGSDASDLNGLSKPVAVSIDALNRWVVVYEKAARMVAKKYDPLAIDVPREVILTTSTIANAYYPAYPAIAMQPHGDFVVGWRPESFCFSDPQAVLARRFDSLGVAKDSADLVVTPSGFCLGAPGFLSADASGDFAAVWSKPWIGYGDSPVVGQFIDRNGIAVGSPFAVSTDPSQEQFSDDVSVASDPAGNILVTWTSFIDDGVDFGTQIWGRFFAAPTLPPPAVSTSYIDD